MKRILLAVLAVTLLWSCGNNNVTIEGKVADGKELSIYLSELNANDIIVVDSAKLTSKGDFKFKRHIEEGQFYTLRLSNGSTITTIAQPEDELYFSGNAKDFANTYTVKGGEDAKKAKILTAKLNKSIQAIEKLKLELKNKSRSQKEIGDEYFTIIKDQRKFTKEFIINNIASLSAYMALYQKINKNTYTLNENKDINFIRAVATSYKRLYPKSQYTEALLKNLETVTSALHQARLKQVIDNTKKSLPEIELPNKDGKKIKLSSLKGKYILLDFTNLADKNAASINRHYKKLYNKYKNRGFRIYQVSLDKNFLLWKEIIKKENINWTNVWDKNSSYGLASRTWNIQKLPSNFIINRKFEIIGKNQFGTNLEDKLKEIFR